jgi:RHS repeat-associated protein
MFKRTVNGDDSHYVWDGWNMIADICSPTSETSSTNLFVWGLDLSLTPQGAGGVGGLLSQTIINASTTNSYFTAYDANGNVSDLVDDSGEIAAHYEYDAFGNQTASSGTFADTNPWRFSTKYWEAETGLLHYELRSYVPTLGRWLNRDPIGEDGGFNLYNMCGNGLVLHIDLYGMSSDSDFDPCDCFIVKLTTYKPKVEWTWKGPKPTHIPTEYVGDASGPGNAVNASTDEKFEGVSYEIIKDESNKEPCCNTVFVKLAALTGSSEVSMGGKTKKQEMERWHAGDKYTDGYHPEGGVISRHPGAGTLWNHHDLSMLNPLKSGDNASIQWKVSVAKPKGTWDCGKSSITYSVQKK